MRSLRSPEPLGLSPWGLVAVSVLMAAAVLVPLRKSMRRWPPPAALEFTLVAAQPGTAELYVDSGRGFNAAEVSRMAFLAGGPQVIRLPLPSPRVTSLRLDPTNTDDVVSITAPAIVGPGTDRLDIDASEWRAVHDVESCRVEGTSLVVDTSGADPQLVMTPQRPVALGGWPRAAGWLIAGAASLVLIACLLAAWHALGVATERLPAAGRTVAWIAGGAAVLVAPRLARLHEPLLDWFSFRQTQTALTAYWFATEGVTLPAYPLPVLGRPWTAPLEFPTFQLVAAAVHRLGVPLDLACRGVGLASFVACCVVLVRLLVRQGCPAGAVALLGAFAFASPFALVWSKAALIEFTAVLFGLGAVALACIVHERGAAARRIVPLVGFGCAAALTKITSFVAFWPAIALLAAHHLWMLRSRGLRSPRLLAAAAAWAAALVVPLVVGEWWVATTDAIKASSETTAWLTSGQLRNWNYGSLAQRATPQNWLAIGTRIHRDVLPFLWPFAIYGVAVLARMPVRLALAGLGMLAGAAAAVVVFFNLYVVHDYYLCTVVFPLWLAAAVGIDDLGRRLVASGAARGLVLPAVLAILVAASGDSTLVSESYRSFGADDLVGFSRLVRQVVPEGEEVIVFGDDWDSRLPYYTRRKSLNVRTPPVSDAYVVDYADRHDVGYLLSAGAGEKRLRGLFPDAVATVRTGPFTLYRRESPPP